MHTEPMQIQQLGAFRVKETLAQSAFTRVCRVEKEESAPSPSTPNSYIAKVLLPKIEGSDTRSYDFRAAHFGHEHQLLRTFSHTSIPAYYGAGEDGDLKYIILEYIDGVDLATLLGHRSGHTRSLSKEIAVYIMGQLADALHHAHTCEVMTPGGKKDDFQALNVLHRDITPSNILVSRYGDVILGDFSSASSSLLDPERTEPAAGTVAYKAPERLMGSGEATVQSELFSLAICLWEILRGTRCFPEADEIQTIDAISRFEISHGPRRVPGLSAKLGEVLRRNLDRDPSRRYKSAYQVLQRLAQSPEAAQAERSRQELAALVRECIQTQESATVQ